MEARCRSCRRHIAGFCARCTVEQARRVLELAVETLRASKARMEAEAQRRLEAEAAARVGSGSTGAG